MWLCAFPSAEYHGFDLLKHNATSRALTELRRGFPGRVFQALKRALHGARERAKAKWKDYQESKKDSDKRTRAMYEFSRFDPEARGTFFGLAVVRALRGHAAREDTDENPRVLVEDLSSYVRRDVPKQMVFLQNFCLSDNLGIAFLNAEERKAVGWTGPAPTPTVGELYLWSILHQMALVQPTCLDATHVLKNFYSIVLKSETAARVLSGESPMGPFKPYFVVPE